MLLVAHPADETEEPCSHQVQLAVLLLDPVYRYADHNTTTNLSPA